MPPRGMTKPKPEEPKKAMLAHDNMRARHTQAGIPTEQAQALRMT